MTLALPEGWEVRRLDEVAEVRLGRQRSPKNHHGPHMRPYVRAANVDWSGLVLDDVKEMNFTEEEMCVYRLAANDIVLNEASGSPDEVGKPAIWSGELADCAFQNTLVRVRSLGPEPKYLLHFFRHLALSRAFARSSRGVGIHHIGRAALASWPIPLPPLSEQRRIVEILEDHLSRLDAAKKSLVGTGLRLTELRRAVLLRAALGHLEPVEDSLATLRDADWVGPQAPDFVLPVGWRWAKWRDIGSSQNGRAFPSSEYVEEGVRLLRPGNLGAGGQLTWEPRTTRCLPEHYRQSHEGLLIRPRDLVMNLTAQSLKDDFLGRVCIVGDADESLLNQRLARLVPHAVSAEFALVVLQSPLFRTYVRSLNSGSLIQHMFTKQLADFWMPVPPSDEDARVVAWAADQLSALGRLEAATARAEPRGFALRRSLLAAAFSGGLYG